VRIEPRNHSRHDTPGGYGITPCATDYVLAHVADGSQIHVALPAGACPGRPSWTADGKRFAFQNIAPTPSSCGSATRRAERCTASAGVRLNPMLGSTVQWMADQKTLLVKLVPDGLGAPPPAPIVPSGPSIQETGGQKGQSSTYETRDTLTSKHDEDSSTTTSRRSSRSSTRRPARSRLAGKVGAYDEVDAAPDGQHILVESIHKPYSYVTTYDHFPRDVDVLDRSGAVVHRVASLPLADRVPIHGVPTGPRDFSWRETEPATLVWAEALDGGDWNVKVPARDKVMLQKAPFTSPSSSSPGPSSASPGSPGASSRARPSCARTTRTGTGRARSW
jgi:dipeptidyl aminopeptidase/acylaminoacyl peptidase